MLKIKTELHELLQLAKQPIVQKLIWTEIQAYVDTTAIRQKLLSQLWDEYQLGKFTPPADITR